MSSLVDQYRAHYAALRQKGRDAFFSSFDGGKTADEYFALAARNWERNVRSYLMWYSAPPLKHCRGLDLGCGGGGMLRAAVEDLAIVSGVDVHGDLDYVAAEIGRDMFWFTQGNGHQIPIENNVFHAAWSWVTFLHLESVRVFWSYVKELWRVLLPDGVAVLYYNPVEEVDFMELRGRPLNTCSLRLNPEYAEDYARGAGFEVLERVRSVKVDGSPGGQAGMVIRKE